MAWAGWGIQELPFSHRGTVPFSQKIPDLNEPVTFWLEKEACMHG